MGGQEDQERDTKKDFILRIMFHCLGIVRQPQNLAEAFGKMSKACN
jgi:hypothetical protein